MADDGWMPFGGGLSIRETLRRAHELPPWPSTGTPQQSAAVMRLLIACAYRVTDLGDAAGSPDRFASAFAAASADGAFDPRRVGLYMDRWRDRFWLIAQHGADFRPFMQDPALAELSPKPVLPSGGDKETPPSRLVPHVWPSYRWGNNPGRAWLTPAEAAVHLLAFMWYGPGGAPDATHPERAGRGRGVWQAGRLRKRSTVHPCGANLYETLILNCIDSASAGMGSGAVGVPEWEAQNPPGVGDAISPPRSIMQCLAGMWEKTALLFPSQDHARVTHVVLATGRLRDSAAELKDPYVLLQRKTGKKANPGETLPYAWKSDKAIWRDLPNLLHQSDYRPVTPILAAASGRPGAVPRSWVVAAHRSDQAKDIAWGLSHIPDRVLSDPAAAQRCVEYLNAADEIDRSMRWAIKMACQDAEIKSDSEELIPDRASRDFWSGIEEQFAVLVNPPSGGDPPGRAQIVETARRAYDRAFRAAGGRVPAKSGPMELSVARRRGLVGRSRPAQTGETPMAAAQTGGAVSAAQPSKDG